MNDSLVPIFDSGSSACCDACGESAGAGTAGPYATLAAGWTAVHANDGDRYLVELCKSCFMLVLGDLKLQRRVRTMFDDTEEDIEGFGRVKPGSSCSVTFGSVVL